MRAPTAEPAARSRDLVLDESLGLNCAWYADILLTLTDFNASVEGIAPPPTSAP